MSPERYHQVTSLFMQAADLPPEERQAFLDRECGVDRDLRERVEQLLAADEQSGQFLTDSPADVAAAMIAAATPDIRPGQRIGEYEVVSRVGEGGVATVYRALDKQLNRPVALKFLAAE